MRKIVALCLVTVVALLSVGCTMTSKAADFNGLKTFDGKTPTHVSTTNVALHFLFKDPVAGNATLEQTVRDFTKEVKGTGAGQVRIVQSNTHYMWYILPPVTFFVQPVITNVAGDSH